MVSTHRRLCQESLDCVEPHEINFKHVSAGFDQVLLAKAVFATPEGVKSGRSGKKKLKINIVGMFMFCDQISNAYS